MKQRYLVICDHEEAYAKRLMGFLSRNRLLDVQVRMVTKPSEAEQFSREKAIGILLISEVFPLATRRKIRAESVFVLTGDGGESPAEKEFAVRKYQPGREILKDIAEMTLKNAQEKVFCSTGAHTTVLKGVYSPFPSARQHDICVQKAERESEKGKTLYVDARVYGGQNGNCETLADLVYELRQSEKAIGLKAGTLAQKTGQLYRILPMPVGRDVREVEKAEWICLLKRLKSCGLYKTVYVEVSEGLQGLLDILALFDEIVMVTEKKMMAVEKQFLDNMLQLEKREILEAVKKGGQKR